MSLVLSLSYVSFHSLLSPFTPFSFLSFFSYFPSHNPLVSLLLHCTLLSLFFHSIFLFCRFSIPISVSFPFPSPSSLPITSLSSPYSTHFPLYPFFSLSTTPSFPPSDLFPCLLSSSHLPFHHPLLFLPITPLSPFLYHHSFVCLPIMFSFSSHHPLFSPSISISFPYSISLSFPFSSPCPFPYHSHALFLMTLPFSFLSASSFPSHHLLFSFSSPCSNYIIISLFFSPTPPPPSPSSSILIFFFYKVFSYQVLQGLLHPIQCFSLIFHFLPDLLFSSSLSYVLLFSRYNSSPSYSSFFVILFLAISLFSLSHCPRFVLHLLNRCFSFLLLSPSPFHSHFLFYLIT